MNQPYRTVTLGGLMACSDTFCFNPVSLPISFTLDLRVLDRTGMMDSSPLRARRARANSN